MICQIHTLKKTQFIQITVTISSLISSKVFSAIGILLLFSYGCTPENPDGVPAHLQAIDSLIVLQGEPFKVGSLNLHKETVYDDSLHLDKITAVSVDENNRVYIAGESWNRLKVFRFDRAGNLLDSLGTYGGGFGAFLEVSRLQLLNNRLYVFDDVLSRVSAVHLESFQMSDTVGFSNFYEQLSDREPKGHSTVKYAGLNGSYLVAYQRERDPAYDQKGLLSYYLTNADGTLLSGKIHEQPDERYLVGDYAGRPAPFTLSLSEKPLLTVSAEGRIYSAFTDEFLIYVFGPDGIDLHSYYYPFQRSDLDPAEVIHPRYSHNNQLLMVRESADYPKQWPALYSMIADDEGKIWISTIGDDRSFLGWYVLDDLTGKLVTSFNWPIDKPIVAVKNGLVYTIEKNSMGYEIVVKYKMHEE